MARVKRRERVRNSLNGKGEKARERVRNSLNGKGEKARESKE